MDKHRACPWDIYLSHPIAIYAYLIPWDQGRRLRGAVVPGPPIRNLCLLISRFAPLLLHISSTVF